MNSEEGDAPVDARTQSSKGGTAAGRTCRRLSESEETREAVDMTESICSAGKGEGEGEM